MKIFCFQNITKKRLIAQFVSIFLIPYLFIILAGILSEVWKEIYFHSLAVIIIALIAFFIQIILFIKSYIEYRKNSLSQKSDLDSHNYWYFKYSNNRNKVLHKNLVFLLQKTRKMKKCDFAEELIAWYGFMVFRESQALMNTSK